jgi:DNA-binding beta-propeller fold protein YncE
MQIISSLLKFRASLPALYICAALTALLCLVPDSSSAFECINSEFLYDIKPGANQPSDLAVAPNGDIYLVDGVNNRIIVIGRSGKWKFSFGSGGKAKGQFLFPLGIDISDSGKVFIADSGNHRIQVFDLKGRFEYMFAVRQDKGESIPDPVDVVASGLKNYLYVADNENHKIKVYKQDGTFEFEWGRFGEGHGELRYPGIMAQNEYNEIFVVDVLNTRVQKFQPFGKFISVIGSWGLLQGELFRPKGVAIDRKNRVFITDSYTGAVQAFTDLGNFVGVLCEKDEKKVFRTPVGIFIDRNDRLLVVEMRANKITVMKLLREKKLVNKKSITSAKVQITGSSEEEN